MKRTTTRRADKGFTLVEILIVIVILGVLATVTIFAVRGIGTQGEDNACSVELRNLDTAEEAHFAITGAYGDEASLVANETFSQESSLYDVALASGEYTISPATGSKCTASSTSG
jgi:prepilin-type N-terminal cleavage/methylation domain-containing protein